MSCLQQLLPEVTATLAAGTPVSVRKQQAMTGQTSMAAADSSSNKQCAAGNP
jgi:hypothetical protein